MGFLDKLFGRDDTPAPAHRPAPAGPALSADEQAIERYRYMLRTAPPETLEQAHAEAFARLTPEQRALLLQQLSADLPAAERAASAATLKDDPQSLARLATRAEVRQPGSLERSFAGTGARPGGMGGMMAGSFLATMAGVVVGSAIAQSFFADAGAPDMAGAEPGAEDAGQDVADAGEFDDGGFDEI